MMPTIIPSSVISAPTRPATRSRSARSAAAALPPHGYAGHPQAGRRPHRRRLRPGFAARDRAKDGSRSTMRTRPSRSTSLGYLRRLPRAAKDGRIDAVAISTPDHWHSQPVIEAALAGKDIYVQKPLSMTVAEGRAVSDIVRAKGRIFQIGSQQRSVGAQFRLACALVRSGRIGKLHTVKVGLPTDPTGGNAEGNAGSGQSELRHVAGRDAAGALQRRARASAKGLRAARLAAHRQLLPRDDHRLGFASRGHRPLGHGHRVDRPHLLEAEGPRSSPPRGSGTSTASTTSIEAKYANGATMIIDDTFKRRHPL